VTYRCAAGIACAPTMQCRSTKLQTIINNTGITTAKLPANLHMRPATLYYLRLEFPSTVSNGGTIGTIGNNATCCGSSINTIYNREQLVVYKLGYTTTTLHERVYGKLATYNTRYVRGKRKVSRIAGHNGMGLPPGTNVHVISTLHHRNAALVYAWEQYLHNKYRAEKYSGPPVMANGNTELYTRDVLDLDY